MSRGKTGLIVLTFLAVFFFLFIAVLFGSSTSRQAALDRKTDLESKLDSIAGEDITIYWIGEPSPELEHLMPVINVITPGTASKDNLPVKSPSFHTSEYNPDGILIEEKIPVEYPEYMVIVISGSPELTDNGKAALLDAVAQNGVPALAIGDEYRRVHKGEGSSLYYCLGKGYRENPIPEDVVKAGGMDLAEAIPDLITLAMSDYTPQI